MSHVPIARQVEATLSLINTVEPRFPIILSNDAPVARRMAAALLARICGSAHAAIKLTNLRRRADLGVVVRSLYEHVVMLAWITGSRAKSEERVTQWQADDELGRGKVDTEVSALLGEDLLPPANRQRVQEIRDAVGKNRALPSLADRAAVADREWAPRMGFADPRRSSGNPLYSLRASYSIAYRLFSVAAHPTMAGMNMVAELTDTQTIVQLEEPTDVGPTVGAVIALLGTALYISSDVLGAPQIASVNAVFDSLESGT